MSLREPCAAGRFYPANQSELASMIENSCKEAETFFNGNSVKLIGGVSPHAGYMFSLSHMIPLFELFKQNYSCQNKVILLNPNHTGLGATLSIDSHSQWLTPLGKVRVDEIISEFLINRSMGSLDIKKEPFAQKREHSAEVILPLIQYFLGSVSFLPLCMGSSSLETCRCLAELIFCLGKEINIVPLIIASSDFNHFASPRQGEELDNFALEALLEFDSKEFLKRIHKKDISICGYGPITVLLEFAKMVSSRPQISILSRGHSGESDYYGGREQHEVVDYISLAVYSEK